MQKLLLESPAYEIIPKGYPMGIPQRGISDLVTLYQRLCLSVQNFIFVFHNIHAKIPLVELTPLGIFAYDPWAVQKPILVYVGNGQRLAVRR